MRSFAALLFTCAAGILLVSYHWQRLPATVASHFHASGAVDGWMSRGANFALSVGLLVGLTAIFWALGIMMRRVPRERFDLPNKAFWFTPERENETRNYLAGWCWTFGALLNLFLAFVFHLLFLANTSAPVAMNDTAMTAGLAVFLAVVLASVVVLLISFGKSR